MTTTNKDVSSVFDFTKRKRWADLLVTELADSIILILSNTSTILYCGSAITELLGWKDSELMDRPFEDLVLGEPQYYLRLVIHPAFSGRLGKSLQHPQERGRIYCLLKIKFKRYRSSRECVIRDQRPSVHVVFLRDGEALPQSEYGRVRPVSLLADYSKSWSTLD